MRSFVFGCLISTLVACSSSNHNGPVCGDGVIEGNEACDDGAANGTSGSTCSSTCTVVAQPFCGDGHVDAGEQCDLGASNGTAGAGCSATCTVQGYITASWAIVCDSTDPNACTPGCPAGFDTAQLVSQEVDSTGTAIGSPKIDLFNCADGTGKSAVLKPGLYQEYIAITDHAGTTTFAQSLLKNLDITTADMSFMENIYVDGGYAHWSWQLVKQSDLSDVTCAQANAPDVEIVTTIVGPGTMKDDLFTCADGQGTTGEFLQGNNYVMAFNALNSSMQSIGSGTSQNVTILGQNQVTELKDAVSNGPIKIQITAL